MVVILYQVLFYLTASGFISWVLTRTDFLNPLLNLMANISSILASSLLLLADGTFYVFQRSFTSITHYQNERIASMGTPWLMGCFLVGVLVYWVGSRYTLFSGSRWPARILKISSLVMVAFFSFLEITLLFRKYIKEMSLGHLVLLSALGFNSMTAGTLYLYSRVYQNVISDEIYRGVLLTTLVTAIAWYVTRNTFRADRFNMRAVFQTKDRISSNFVWLGFFLGARGVLHYVLFVIFLGFLGAINIDEVTRTSLSLYTRQITSGEIFLLSSIKNVLFSLGFSEESIGAQLELFLVSFLRTEYYSLIAQKEVILALSERGRDLCWYILPGFFNIFSIIFHTFVLSMISLRKFSATLYIVTWSFALAFVGKATSFFWILFFI